MCVLLWLRVGDLLDTPQLFVIIIIIRAIVIIIDVSVWFLNIHAKIATCSNVHPA